MRSNIILVSHLITLNIFFHFLPFPATLVPRRGFAYLVCSTQLPIPMFIDRAGAHTALGIQTLLIFVATLPNTALLEWNSTV